MTKDLIKKISKEVVDKYDIISNSFVVKDKGEEASKFEVEVGDVLQDDFFPQIKIKRWDNECNFSVRLIDDDPDEPTLKTEENKIKFIKNKIECHFYKDKMIKDDGREIDIFEFEIILKEKPDTNLIRKTIQTKGLKFCYQPPLTEEYKIGDVNGRVAEVTETDVKDKNGKVVCHRPKNVVKSYAVYHESKKGDYKAFPNGKNFRAGKAFHIYRPQMIDANGWKVWGEMNIDIETGIQTIIIPQNFFDNAVYPVRHASGETFGHTGVGESIRELWEEPFFGILATPQFGGVATSISVYMENTWFFERQYCFGMYNSDGDFIEKTEEGELPAPTSADWFTKDFLSPPSISSSVEYLMTGRSDDDKLDCYYDSVGESAYAPFNLTSYNDFPSSVALYPFSSDLSIYVTYTPAPIVSSPNFTKKNNYTGQLAFVQQFIKHRRNDTTPWSHPDGFLI